VLELLAAIILSGLNPASETVSLGAFTEADSKMPRRTGLISIALEIGLVGNA
jgi:hypothetical protein